MGKTKELPPNGYNRRKMRIWESTSAIIWRLSLLLVIVGLILLDCKIFWVGGGLTSIGVITAMFSPLIAELIDDEINSK